MPDTPALTTNEKIAKLRQKFMDQLPSRQELILDLWERLKSSPADMDALTELHRAVHSLKGTGRSFGFSQLGDASEKGESLMSAVLESPEHAITDKWLSESGESILLISSIIDSLNGTEHEHETDQFLIDIAAMRTYWPSCDCRGKLVYLCDDDPVSIEQVAAQLTCFGYQTMIFSELQKLRDSISQNRPDALIMDINFPEGRYAGTTLVESLRKELHYNMPVIFLSGRDDFDARLSAVLAGGSSYFNKPPNIQELITALDLETCQERPEPFRILIIDDEPTVADYHSLILQEAGMITRCIQEPSEVLCALQELRPDLVLMDMYMPACSGYDLARLIRQVHEYMSIPIIYLSSETDRQKQFTAMRVGAEGFMTKPVVPSELIAAVEIRAERMRSLRALMVRDSLTGLFNHTTTTHLLDTAISSTRRHGKFLSFAMIDIDYFKKVNDTYGHPKGDQVILALSRILKQRLRSSDVIGRYGGEEFALILPEADTIKSFELLDELRQDFARLTFNCNDRTFNCSFSAGISAYPKFNTLEHLREAADQALYKAKHGGRNQVIVA